MVGTTRFWQRGRRRSLCALATAAAAFVLWAMPSLAATTAGSGVATMALSYGPGVGTLSQALSGGCASDTVSTVGALPAGGAVVNTQDSNFAGLVTISFSATSSCSNLLGDSSAATTVSVSGSNGPSTLSCSFSANYGRLAAIVIVDGPGSCVIDNTATGPVTLTMRLVVAPSNVGGGVVAPMTSAVAAGSWAIQPASS